MKLPELIKLIGRTLQLYFRKKPFIIMFSAFLLLMLWGYHGNLDLLKLILPAWSPPGENTSGRPPILSWIPWDREFISFIGGALLLVVIPCILIVFFYKEPLSNYGLALPAKGKRVTGLVIFLLLVIVLLPGFYVASSNHDMSTVYPFYKNFTSIKQFIIYECSYFPFFVAIEFIFRGYLLFGLSNVKETNDTGTYFIGYGIIIQMLSYTAWHLGKPLTELWGTPVWGLVTGIITYRLRSIWPVTMAHWVLNIFLDAMILKQLHILF